MVPFGKNNPAIVTSGTRVKSSQRPAQVMRFQTGIIEIFRHAPQCHLNLRLKRGVFPERRRNARSNLVVGTSPLMAHLVLRRLAMSFSADWLLSLPERKALMALLASAAVSCRHVSMRRWRNKLSSISCSSAGNASASARTRSKVKAAINAIRWFEFPPFARYCQVILTLDRKMITMFTMMTEIIL